MTELTGPAKYHEEQRKLAERRKLETEVKGLYDSTKSYPWHSAHRWNVNSLAAKFDLTHEEVRAMLSLHATQTL